MPFRISLLALTIILLAGIAPVFGQMTANDIEALRQQGRSAGWTFEISANPATEHTSDELTGLVEPSDWREKGRWDNTEATSKDLPSYFDWRDVGDLTMVKDQASCGSCWAFATIGPFESQIKLKDGVDVDLSEQYLVSCNTQGYDCEDGGWYAYDHFLARPDECDSSGAVLEEDFPYVAADIPCECPYQHHYVIEDWSYIGYQHSTPSVNTIKQAILDHGPISVAINATDALQGYSGGIFNEHAGGGINHAVVLVGWDDSQGAGGVWFMRNSWGTMWGEDGGYCRIEYNCNQVGYASAWMYYHGVSVEADNSFGPSPLTVDFNVETPMDSISACEWEFGDSQSAFGPGSTHLYPTPGHYDVTATFTTANGTFEEARPHMVSVYADSMFVGEVEGEPGQPVRVDVSMHNFLDVKALEIPFTWEGPLALVYDSFSTVGLRTEYFELQNQVNFDYWNDRATVLLTCSNSGTSPYLAPGSGPVVSLWFTMPAVPVSADNPIDFTNYASFAPTLTTYPGEYPAVAFNGAVTYSSTCCSGPSVGNVDSSPDNMVTMGDLTILIDHLFISLAPLTCIDEGNVDGSIDKSVTMGDLTVLIDHLFISLAPLAPCP